MGTPPRFQVVAAGFGLAAVTHAAEGVASLLGHAVRDYPLWRHGAFITLDAALGALALTKPRLLWLPVILLLVQQSGTHGASLLLTWRTTHTVSWLSLATLLFLAARALLALEHRWHASARPTKGIDATAV